MQTTGLLHNCAGGRLNARAVNMHLALEFETSAGACACCRNEMLMYVTTVLLRLAMFQNNDMFMHIYVTLFKYLCWWTHVLKVGPECCNN